MINMWKADLYRIIRSKGMIIYWVIVVLLLGITINLQEAGGIQLGTDFPVENAREVKLDIEQLSANSMFYFLFLFPIFAIIVSDLGHKTVKNTISSVASRGKYYISKCSLGLLYVVGSYVLISYGYYFVNKVVNGEEYSSAIGEFSIALFKQLPAAIEMASVFCLVAFFFKKVAVFNSLTLIIPTVYNFVAAIIYELGSKTFVMNYMLKYEMTGLFRNLVLANDAEYVAKSIMVSIGISIAALILGYLAFTKREIE